MNYRALLSLALIHMLVDGYSQLVMPLWPTLKEQLHLADWAFVAIYGCWQVAASVSQPLFGYWGDRFGSRWLVYLGPALVVGCLSLIGLADQPVWLALLLVLGGLGNGGFHPEAAAGVVQAGGSRGTRAVSFFVFGGMLGLGLGPLVSGGIVKAHGLAGLVWLMPPGLAVLLALALLHRPAPHTVAAESAAGSGKILGDRWPQALLLLAVSTLRTVPVQGLPLALAFWLKQRGDSEEAIGGLQSLFLLSGGLGTLLCPLVLPRGREVAGLVWTIVPAAGFLLLLRTGNPAGVYTGLAGAGLLLQGAIPILIGYSQRLLPRGRRLAASLILGSSWGLSGIVVAQLQAHFNDAGRPQDMIWALAPITVLAGLGSLLLPGLEKPVMAETHHSLADKERRTFPAATARGD